MAQHSPTRLLLNATVSVLLVLGVAAPIHAQSASDAFNAGRHKDKKERQEAEKETKVVDKYPNATRKEPEAKASAKLGPKLKKIFDAYEASDPTKVVPQADEMIADPKANAYERSMAARLAAASLIGDDDAKAMGYLQKTLESDGLSNNDHYDTMLTLAQLQIQADQDAPALATLDKLLQETKSTSPEILVFKGNALYRLERYPEAAAVLEQAIAATPDPKPEWQQLLMGTYAEMGQPEKAAKLAETIAAKTPNDKKAQMNLAAVYMQGDQNDKAIAVLEKLRAAGQLTDDKDYRNLYALYMNTDGKEKQAIAVINEGLDKGILKPDSQTYATLAQAYYYSDQPGPAIEAYKKAAPIAPDGEMYLNLGKLLWGEGRIGEAKQAAKQALDKGLKKPEEARKILALKGG